MKHKFFKALDEIPFVVFLAVVSSMSVFVGILMIILCIVNGTIKFKDLPMALFVIATAHISIWIAIVVIVAYIIVRTLDFHSVVNGRKRLN